MDKVRMVAALLVMTGHLLHVKASNEGFLIGSHLEDILSSGSFAVVVFFGLSGIALRYQTQKYGISCRWMFARIIRLMPVYWITLIPPIIGYYLIGAKIEYPTFGFLISGVGLQAIINSLAVPPVNRPLWSLSVEIYLSSLLLVIGRYKKNSGILVLSLLIGFNLLFPENAIIRGLPIFYFGYLLPGIKLNFLSPKILRYLVASFPVFVLLVSPHVVQGRYAGFENFLVMNSLAGLVIISSLLFIKSTSSFFSDLSQRSYSLYAVHFPLIQLIDKTLFFSSPKTSAGQFLISVLVVSIATEIHYRFVEKPSIKYSRNYLIRTNS